MGSASKDHEQQKGNGFLRACRRARARLDYSLLQISPPKLLLFGYLSYITIGFVLLSLPFAQEVPVATLDNLFIATSAVSTTGLVTVDPGSSYTFFGELIIILLIQMGGLGYMTIGSFIILTWQSGLNRARNEATRHAFNLPEHIKPRTFVYSVMAFTFICELLGVLVFYPAFLDAGVENPLWLAIFHSVSAFCTAGFSLFSNSLEDFNAHGLVSITAALLSIAGAMGFLIVVDFVRTFTGQSRYLGFTSKVIFRITAIFLIIGTALVVAIEPSISDLPPYERVLAAFFQVASASTTVGFNTVPISNLATPTIVILCFLMAIGASPAGTGGGLKTTSFAALVGLVRSTTKGRDRIRFFKREIPLDRLQFATASLAYYVAFLMFALFVLSLTEPAASLKVLFFEIISALGTVGLSLGITGDLSPLGKITVIFLMTAGRVGILTFGMALATRDESREEEEDNNLVL